MSDGNIGNYTPLSDSLYKSKNHLMIILLVSTLFIIFLVSTIILYSNITKNKIAVKNTAETSEILDTNSRLSTDENLKKIPTLITKLISPTVPLKTIIPTKYITSSSSKPTNTPTPTIKPLPTSTPVPRTPNPPITSINFPSEMQSISLTTGQTFCAVEVPNGGGPATEKRQNLNDQGWNSYGPLFTTCFEPKEGLNKIQFQFKNAYGDESQVITRNFNFHRISDMTISLTGTIYRDENCNGVRDGSEGAISTPAIVDIFKETEHYIYGSVTSDSSGNFSFSKSVSETDTVSLQPSIESPSGYTGNYNFQYPTVTLNSSNKSGNVSLPQVPNENHSNCHVL